MKDSSTGNSIGWGCTAALMLSAIALTGSCTLLGMSWLIKDNHAPKSLEDSARRVAVTSLLISGLSVVGGIIAGAISESERLDKLLLEKQSVIQFQKTQIRELTLRQEQEIYLVTVSRKEEEYRSAIEGRDKEIFDRGNTIRDLRQELKSSQELIDNWKAWWNSAREIDPKYDFFGCRGCKYFDGSKHEGNLLVCAMHPYGQKNCEDWESNK